MEKKYLNEYRYKKGTSRKRRDANTVKSNLNSKDYTKQVKVKTTSKPKCKKRIKRNTTRQNKLGNVVICILLLIAIAIISRAILKEENEPFIPLPFFEQANDEVITLGVITSDSLLNSHNKNCVINELNKYSKDMLLSINDDYSITYGCISNVTKVSNKEYVLTRNEQSKVSIEDIKTNLSEYMKDKSSVYYSKLENISDVQIIDANTLNIKLKSEMPYFIYNLDICLTSSKDVTNYIMDGTSSASKLIFTRHKNANKQLPEKVVVIRYKDMYSTVQAYKNKEIDMFVTDAENVENILGKYEYNIKKYRNGGNVFLFGNPISKLYSKSEVRQAIAYSIDRTAIIDEVLKSKGDKIDLPYVYDQVKYKYDVYAAENLLLTNEYKKVNKVYSKTENGVKTTLEMNLIVNKNDQTKVSIANKIKNNLNAIGIKINVEKLTEAKLQDRIKKGTYDLVLASVNLNNIPDISFVSKNLFMSETTKQLVQKINNSTVQDLGQNITLLQKSLSEDVAAIGIYSDVSYLVYSKNIVGIDEINYMNLFKSILS